MLRKAIILKTSEKELLFRPAECWSFDSLISSGFPKEEIYLSSSLEETLSLLNGFSDGTVFLTFSHLAFIDEEVIDSSFALYNSCEKPVLCAFNPDSGHYVLWGEAEKIAALLTEIKTDFSLFDKSVVAFAEYGTRKKFLSAEDPLSLFEMNKAAATAVLEKHIKNGVNFLSSDGILISPEVEIGKNTTILPGTILKGKTVIGENCTIGPNSFIEDSIIGNSTEIDSSKVRLSNVGNNVSVGPFSQLRPNTVLSDGVHVGDFVEIKNSTVGEGTAVAHLTYVGDSDVGKNVNFGCGVVTVNYDGESKNRTTIGDYSFIGCNTNLVAPVNIGNKAYTAAGSTITKDVPDGALAIARNRQENKENWAEKKLSAYVEKKNKK